MIWDQEENKELTRILMPITFCPECAIEEVDIN